METRNILIIGVILAGAFMRLIPHVPNIAPIGAMALFSGYYLRSYKAYIIPFGALLLSDVFLGFYEVMPFVYASFFITMVIGRQFGMQEKKSTENVIRGMTVVFLSVINSVLFYLVTNFGVWMMTSMYQHNASGLLQSYAMALPFFRNTIVGDLFYNTIFFFSFYWMSQKARHYKFFSIKTIFG